MEDRAACVLPEESWSEEAERVRAYLVAVRGGAPFLSPADARLLLGWLDEGVPVAAILAAIDRAQDRRRRRRVRSRLSLRACRGELRRLLGRGAGKDGDEAGTDRPAGEGTARAADAARRLRSLAEAVAAMEVEEADRPHRDALARRLRALAGTGGAPEHLAERAAEACRAFHEAAWAADAARREALLSRAAEDLAPLRDALEEADFLRIVEETARHALRGRHPLVSADRLWDTLCAR